MSHWEFPRTEPVDVRVNLTSGQVRIAAQPTEMITVDVRAGKPGRLCDQPRGDDDGTGVSVEYADGQLEITESQPQGWLRFGPSSDIDVMLPAGSRCSVKAISADVTAAGELGSLDVKTVSGDVTGDSIAGDLRLTTTSGQARVKHVVGAASVKSASGAVELGQIGGDVSIQNVSGRVLLAAAAGPVSVRTASGRVTIDRLGPGRAEITTVSGDVSVNVATGTGVYLDLSSLSGHVTSDLEPSEASEQVDLHLHCRSVSGSLRVGRAVLIDVVG